MELPCDTTSRFTGDACLFQSLPWQISTYTPLYQMFAKSTTEYATSPAEMINILVYGGIFPRGMLNLFRNKHVFRLIGRNEKMACRPVQQILPFSGTFCSRLGKQEMAQSERRLSAMSMKY